MILMNGPVFKVNGRLPEIFYNFLVIFLNLLQLLSNVLDQWINRIASLIPLMLISNLIQSKHVLCNVLPHLIVQKCSYRFVMFKEVALKGS